MTHKHWTPEEISYIKEKYPVVETKVLAKRLSVTETQIRAVIKKHDLKKRAKIKTSTNNEKDHYLKGYSFWSENTFWRRDGYSKAGRERLDNWLDEMRTNERSLTRLSA